MRVKLVMIIIPVLVVLIASAVLFYYLGSSHPDFYADAKQEFNIPGLDTKFVPQGLEYDGDHNIFLVSGYMSDGSASRVYVIDKNSGEAKSYFTLNNKGQDYTGHAGGIATSQGFVWIVGDKKVYRFSLSDAINAKDGEKVEIIDSFKSGNGADFVLCDGNNLIVGEFYKKKKYETLQEHHITISETETNRALAYVFAINTGNKCGVEALEPIAVISLPDLAQGMTFNSDGNIVISTSYSVPDSKILIYNNVLESGPEKEITLNNKLVPLYVLSKDKLIKSINAPAMSEEVVLCENRVYVLFESNCKKYKLVNRKRLSHVYSLGI